jgi:hypothetical protein
VVSLHLVSTGNDEPPVLENIALVEGTPSTVSLGKYEEGETTDALAERLIPTESFEQSGHIQLRPRGVLAIGETYTVISNLGVLGVVVVAPANERHYFARVWPPVDSVYGIVQAIYCGQQAPSSTNTVELFPPGRSARVIPGLDESGALKENCIRLIPSEPTDEIFLPPVGVENLAFEPSLFENSQRLDDVLSANCEATEISFGPGCMRVEGDRAVVRGPSKASFWVLSSGEGTHFQSLEANARFVVPSLRQLTDGVIAATVFDLAGRSIRVQTQIQPPEPSARVLINEVMSNPLGAEPAEEWVELMNAGDLDAVLQNYALADGGGQVSLPPMVLGPGAFVLLTRNDFVGGTAGDLAPSDGVTVVRLPQLGKSGLSNSGENLTLLDGEGTVVSAFPSRASERAGTSIARRDPSVLDDDPSGFLSHAPPGASPGGKNQVE